MPDPILEFAETDGWQLRGAFVFDGRGQLEDLIRIRGKCAGLTLEGSSFRGFTRSAVRMMNCEGPKPGRSSWPICGPMAPSRPKRASLSRSAPTCPTRVNQYIDIRNCQFDGVKERVQVPKPEWGRNVKGIK